MEIVRKRPLKMFEVIQAYGGYRKGDRIQPTGMYRDVLKSRGLIREVTEHELAAEYLLIKSRQAQSGADRMVRLPEKSEARPILHVRGRLR